MRFVDRILIGLMVILVSCVSLWLGSPARTGASDCARIFGS